MMKKFLLAALFSTFIALAASSQYYDSAIGLRAGWGYGLTYKKALGGDNAAEFILNTRYGGLAITGLYEKSFTFFDVPRTQWYIGGGGHLGFYNTKRKNTWFENESDDGLLVGLDGILGIEVTLNQAPLNFSLDWKPAIQLLGQGFIADGGALSIRYVIN